MGEYLAPGVYVEELPTNKPIEGASTSTAGIVGVTERGPVNATQLVTSYPEYVRMFGGALPQDEFTDSGRSHCYLPHAVEGFFVNGGKRAYVTRVLPLEASFASRELFFADLANPTPGDTVLLRAAQQNTGTAINLPLLYALSASNFAVNDWVRIGDGSHAEYRQVQSVAAAGTHTSLNFPLHFAHPAGELVRTMPIAAVANLVNLALAEAVTPGATQIALNGADIGNLPVGSPGPGARRLLQIGGAAVAEYAFAAVVVSISATELRVTLSSPLTRAYIAGTVVNGLDTAGGVPANLTVPAHAGDLLLYGPASTTVANIAVIGFGTPNEEVQGIGQLAELPLAVGAYGPYPAGTVGELVTVADDARTVAAWPSRRLIPIDTVAAMTAGMPFVRGPDNANVVAIEPNLRLLELDVDLGGAAPAAGQGVTVGGNPATIVAWPTNNVVPLQENASGITSGMPVVRGADNSTVAAVYPDIGVVTLTTTLPGAALTDGDAIQIGGSPYTARTFTRQTVVPLDRVDGLVPGMSLSFGADARIVAAVDPVTRAVRLQTALPAVPAAASAVTFEVRHTTQAIGPGTVQLALDNRLALEIGDVLRIGTAPNDEYVTIVRIAGERGPAPDAGVVQLEHPVDNQYASGADVHRLTVTVNTARQPAILALAAHTGDDDLLASDGTNYAANDVIRFTAIDGSHYLHRLNGNEVNADPREIGLSAALEFGHAAGQPLVEREQLFEVRALDAGNWGNRLMVACREEQTPLVNNAIVLNANPPPMPGTFSSLQLASITGVEPGTILEMDNPDGTAVLPLLKARSVDRATRLVTLDAPGLQPQHIAATTNAQAAGESVTVRSREFSLTVMLRQRPDPTAPVRDDNLLDQEVFRQLSMDPRHSRYIERIIGCTYTPGADFDDAQPPNPVRRWDRRSEGASWYARVLDAEVPANRQRIRIGPETLVDIMPSGLERPARHRLSGGDDLVSSMDDAIYVGADSTVPEHRTGLYTLKNLIDVSLVSIPGQVSVPLQQSIIDHCEEMRYRFAVLDGPPPPDDTVADVQNLRQSFDSEYCAFYHPWMTIPDPFPASPATIRQYPIPPCGHMLGIYARVDNDRGVHKAPANEVIRGITGYTRYFTKGEQEILNPYPVNINVLRDFRATNRGLRVWGARVATSDPAKKYVNVRRLLNFVEDSIDRGMQWVVFEPNDDQLWARVRRSVSNFLLTVWRNGALEGRSQEQAFFVKCDATTMTRDDRDNGRLIVIIGIAPVKPAEFVIARVALFTADAKT
jgi:phage tail sheath protein FI